jgi:beta-galactosidase
MCNNRCTGQCGSSCSSQKAPGVSSCASGGRGGSGNCGCGGGARSGSIELTQRHIRIDGKPRLVLAGEVHYFRLHPDQWEDRLRKLKENGLDTVATYIPWVWHELQDGTVDLTGATHPQRDVVSFLDLCHQHGLNVIARPGPFVMAELKNEGVPYRLYKAPFVQPTTWYGKPITTRTLDYLDPDFLAAARGWYDQVMPVLAPRLYTRGGSVVAVQLDNEIGMLSWVSNCPDLTDNVCEDMRLWARMHYGEPEASTRFGANSADKQAWAAHLRTPGDDSLPLHHMLGLYMRDRFRRYVSTLRRYAEDNDVSGVPFLVNVHGTGGGRGRTFPIGISQLFESYRGEPQMTAGTDLYLGNLTVSNVGDLVAVNAFMHSTLGDDQPLMSLEFEAGNGNYGDDLGILYDAEAVAQKTAICIAQGNRALSYYLQAGGENPPLPSTGDGIDRLAFTGQEHGFAAPVGPSGKLDYTYAPLSRVVQQVRAVEEFLADSQNEHDGVAIGFVPDHYMSEYRYPGSPRRQEQVSDFERYRGFGPRDLLARAMVLGGYSFPAVNLQDGVPSVPVVAVATGRTLGANVQQSLVDYLEQGGKLLLVGLLPDQDDDGNDCTILADALGLKSAGRVEETGLPNKQYWPSVAAHGWLAPHFEARVTTAQLLESANGEPLVPLLSEIATGKPCAVEASYGAGKAIVLGCDYPAHIDVYQKIFTALGVTRRWELDSSSLGIVAMSTVSGDGQRLLHLVNVAPTEVTFTLRHNGVRVFNGRTLRLPARANVILPMGVKLDAAEILVSTAEIVRKNGNSITLHPTQERDTVVLHTTRPVECKRGTVTRRGNRVTISLDTRNHGGKPVIIRIK